MATSRNQLANSVREILTSGEQIACTQEEWETVKEICQDYLVKAQDIGQGKLAQHILREIRRLTQKFQ